MGTLSRAQDICNDKSTKKRKEKSKDKSPETWGVTSGFRASLPVWSSVWSPLRVPEDDELENTLTRNWQYLNPDEHIFVPLQVPLRTLDLIQMWCRTSKTSSDTVVFFLLKTTYSDWAPKLGGFYCRFEVNPVSSRTLQTKIRIFFSTPQLFELIWGKHFHM